MIIRFRVLILLYIVFIFCASLIITGKAYTKQAKYTETFEVPNNDASYRFHTPVSFENDNKLRFDNEVTFQGNAHIDTDTSIILNKAPVFKENGVIHFENPDVNISLEDAKNIKIARAKLEHLRESQDVGNLEDGKFTHVFSSKLSGTNACTSRIWDVLVGKDISASQLCKSCCSLRKEQQIDIILNEDERLHFTIQTNPISVSQVQYKVFVPSQLIGLGDASYTIDNMVCFRSTQNIKCRMILTNNALNQIQNQNYRPTSSDVIIYPTTMREEIEQYASSDKVEKWGSNIQYIEWGSFQYMFPLETVTYRRLIVSKIVVQILPDNL